MDFNLIKRQDGEVWVDGEGKEVPRKYVSAWQRLEERKVNAIYNLAKSAWGVLRNKKKEINRHAEQLIKEYYKTHKIDPQKSFTFYNFNKTVMFEIDGEKQLKNGLMKVYYRIRIKNYETKNYDLLDINFSSIDL